MKAISIYPESVEVGGKAYPKIQLYADSAIGRDVMPLFVPDIPLRWCGRICIAVRIVRLGKNIAARFAPRYIDAIGLVALISPDIDVEQAAAFVDCGAMHVLDSAVITGQWHGCDVGALEAVTVDINGISTTFQASDLAIADSISSISRLATLKTGDIIIIESTALPFDLAIDTRLNASLNGERCLALKIK